MCLSAGLWVSAVCCSIALLAAGQAHAEPGYVPVGSTLAGSSAPVEVATEDSTGNVLVTDLSTPWGLVFGPDAADGTAPIATVGMGDLVGTVRGIAVDQVNGDVYVYADGSGITRFTSDGATPPTYTNDAAYTSPAFGSDAGQIGGGANALGIDPANHDLLVADPANGRVSRFADDGSFVSSFNGADTTAGQFSGPIDIAIASNGDIYVTDATGDVQFGGASRVERFDSAGQAQGQLGPLDTPGAIAIDPDSQQVVIADHLAFGSQPRLSIFDQGALVTDRALPGEFFMRNVTGMAIAKGSGRLYAASTFFGSGDVRALDRRTFPEVTLDPPSAITATSVQLSGTVDPDGVQASAHFEYSTNGADWTPTPEQDAGSTPGSIQADVTDLQPNTDYRVRLVASNADVSATSPEQTFTTDLAPPEAVTGSASSVTTTAARLNGTVNPFGANATYHFEYGTDTDYGQRVPATEAQVGIGRNPRNVGQAITELAPGATYHYRIVATNSVGTTNGSDRTFTTLTADLPARAYELASPVDKGGSNVRPVTSHQSSLSGDSVVYTAKTPFGGGLSEAAPFQPRYFAVRGTGGWSSKQVDPPQWASEDRGTQAQTTFAISADNSKALVISNRALAPGAVDGQGNLYLRDTSSGAYTLMATSGEFVGGESFYRILAAHLGNVNLLVGATTDFGTVVVNSPVPLLPGGERGLYEWSDGSLKAVGKLPDGTSVVSENPRTVNAGPLQGVSKDGRRVFFTTPPTDGNSSGPVFVREDDTTTKAISVVHLDGEPQDPAPGVFAGASDDGSVVFFTSTVPLVDEAVAEGGNLLYRYDMESDQLTLLSHVKVSRVLQVSGDGQFVYFLGGEDQTIRVWHEGQTRDVALLTENSGFPAYFLASPNGRYAVVRASDKLTDYDNISSAACPAEINYGNSEGHCFEFYLYDAVEDTLECASCNTDGSKPLGHAFSTELAPAMNHYQRILTDGGRVFFDSVDRLVDADSGGTSDVYMYEDGRHTLISRGTPGITSQLADADATGDSVFFTTNEQLVRQDTDNLNDLYVARPGGGFASQNPPPPPAGCAGEGCLGERSSAPALQPTGTVTFVGDGNVSKAPPVRVSSRKTVRGARATLKVRVPGKGRIGISGRHVRSVHRSVSKSGAVTLRLSLTRAGRAALRRSHRLRVKLEVTFSPSGGGRSKASLRITFRTSRGGAR